MNICLKIDEKITAEEIVQMDIKGSIDEKFTVGWVLETITNYVYEMKNLVSLKLLKI